MKSKQTQEQIIVFSRYPVPGTTKTRLARALGDLGAAEMQKKLTEHTISQVRQFLQINPVAVPGPGQRRPGSTDGKGF
jgi:glycosyltransferase A (GT-A) superfamily protein (DUF2064 family)